jgi:hypothetical protein
MDDERTEEQDEAADDVEPNPDAGVPADEHGEDPAASDGTGESIRELGAGM